MNTHFIELKERIIYCVCFFITIFITLFYFSDIIYDLFSIPIKIQNIDKNNLIAIKITSTFIVPLKLTFYTAIIISLPYFILNIWKFIEPGLYKKEKISILPATFTSLILFFIGIAFGFYIICPIAINFFINCAPSNVKIMISIENYMDFIFTITISSSLAFQIPLIIKLITKLEIIEKETLKEKRAYITVIIFIIAMLLTPPDVISQIILAIPILILFEIGLIISK